jgi:hypothetical protein
MDKSSKNIKILRLFAALLILILAMVLLFPQRINTTFKSGDSITIEAPSFLASAAGSTCIISINLKSGMMARITLVQSWFHTPLIVIPSTNGNIFYCIYDHDTDFQLLKFDLEHTFQPPAKDQVMSSSILGSSCEVDRVKRIDTNDWIAVTKALQQMSPDEYDRQVIGGLRFGLFRIHTDQIVVVNSMRNYGDQGGYNGDPPILSHM